MKSKRLILILSCVVLLIILLIILYTCYFFPDTASTKPPPQKTEKMTEVPSQESPKPKKQNPQEKDTKISNPTPSPEKPAASNELFEYLTEYEGHTYFISKNKVKWVDAAAICKQNGGHLVTITSGGENRAVIAGIKEKQPDNWASKEKREENFVLIWFGTGKKLPYHWNDACDLIKARYILEIEPK
ncbi:MAG: C-type lectin domain-containing protein [Spirochaetia bacterium]